MSQLSAVQFEGVTQIADSIASKTQRPAGALASSVEIGMDDESGKVRLQPAGTNRFKLYEAYEHHKLGSAGG